MRCAATSSFSSLAVEQITAPQLKEWLAQSQGETRSKPLLLDVREAWELDICRLADVMPMPMGGVPVRYTELDPETDVVVICHHGARSFQVAMFLEQQGFKRVFNLYGGIAAWSQEVDPTMPRY
jgi:rhodanese-related sulfurtransferase